MNTRNGTEGWVRCDRLYTPLHQLDNALLEIRHGRFRQITNWSEAIDLPENKVIHEPDAIVAPGFIDLHIHGARGRDLMDGTRESLIAVSETLAGHGTTAFLATTFSATDRDTETALCGFAEHKDSIRHGAVPLGVHLEGPFLNPGRCGTHNAGYLRHASVSSFRRYVELSGNSVLRMTVAPEMDDELKVIREAVQRGIRISIGHSDATEAVARAAVDVGASQATHTFNAMRPLHQREPGVLGLVLTDDRILAEVIADGIHVHWSSIKLLVRAKGLERIMLVTDGISSVDMPDGQYPLGDKMIVVRGGECRDPDGALAGSALTLDAAVRNMLRTLGLSPEGVLAAASLIPARGMGLANRKGVVAPGADADLVFLDRDLQVIRTIVGGRTVYRRAGGQQHTVDD